MRLPERTTRGPRPAAFAVLFWGVVSGVVQFKYRIGQGVPITQMFSQVALGLAFTFGLSMLVQAALRIPRILNSALVSIAGTLYAVLTLFLFQTGDCLRWPLIESNLTVIWKRDALLVLFNGQTVLLWVIACVTFFLTFMLEKNEAQISSKKAEGGKMFIGFGIMFACCVTHSSMADPIGEFVLSAFRRWEFGRLARGGISLPDYDMGFANNKPIHKYNVLLVILESISAKHLDRIENNKPVTPVMNSLSQKMARVPRFYANATYTIAGQAAILTGLPSPLAGNFAVDLQRVNVPSLPRYLDGWGYSTHFIAAQSDLDFANTYAFMRRIGFSNVTNVDKDTFISPEDHWGWGVQDDAFYKASFRILDPVLNNHTRPWFLTLSTVVNHYPFDKLPSIHRDVYPHAKNTTERYVNSAHFSDHCLITLFELLQNRSLITNTIIIITADHPMPVGEHSRFGLNDSYYEENFSIPCFISFPDQRRPLKFNPEITYSQIDIFPTVVALLTDAQPVVTFGKSMLNEEPRLCFCVQQIGKAQAVCYMGFEKYVYNFYSGEELLFNVDNDPLEQKNLIAAENSQIGLFRTNMGTILRLDSYYRRVNSAE